MIKGFILSAGFSKRLRPITEYIPKPLLPIAGEVLLEYIYKFLKSSGINELGINLHYKADKIERYIRENNFALKIFHEKEILNTGGALYNARNFLKDAVFIVHNADIYWNGNIKEAIEWHINSENSITLLVHDYAPHNKLIIDNEGNFIGLMPISCHSEPGKKMKTVFPESRRIFVASGLLSRSPLAFTGVAIYSPDVLELLPPGASSIIDLWLKAKDKGLKVRVFRVKYSFWYDIGTSIEYARAVFDKLKRNFTSLYVHPASSGCELIDTRGNVVIERNVKIKKPFLGRNIIILPETEVSPEAYEISDCIIGKVFFVSIAGWQGQEENLTHGGSARRYFRRKDKVFCEWEEINQDFEKTIKLGKFLKEKGFPVPEIIDVNKEKKLIIFEDLGDLTLYSWLQCRRNSKEILNVYKQIIEKIVHLHRKVSSEASELDTYLPEFDYNYFRWESEYFLEEYVSTVFKIELSDIASPFSFHYCEPKARQFNLRQELHLIAEQLSKSKKVILHRDLQSQNIMLKLFIDSSLLCHSELKRSKALSLREDTREEFPRVKYKIYFVDYQSARWGPAGYDLASLLWDPYVNLSNEIRHELVNYYILNSSDALNLSSSAFLEELSLCRIQRHMQALGAYGFLSLKKGMRNFLKFIPSALNLLYQDIEECPIELPKLRELVFKLKNFTNNPLG